MMRHLRFATLCVPLVLAAASALHGQASVVERREILVAAIRSVMADVHYDTLATTCVSMAPANRRAEPYRTMLAALRMRHRGPVVPPSRCPPTYETGERVMNPPPGPRPRGAIDPYILSIRGLTMLGARQARVEIREDRSSATTAHECIATREVDRWIATCRVISMAIA